MLATAVEATTGNIQPERNIPNVVFTNNYGVYKVFALHPIFDDATSETVIKRYANAISKGCISPFMKDFKVSKSARIEYRLIDKFLDKHLDGIAMISKLQEFGDEKSEHGIKYSLILKIAHYSYIFKSLVRSGILSLGGEKNVSFDALYEYITRLVPEGATNVDRSFVLESIKTMLERVIILIEKYWSQDLSTPTEVSADEIASLGNDIKNNAVLKEFYRGIHNMWDQRLLELDAYIKIQSFCEIIYRITLTIQYYIELIVALRSDDSEIKRSICTYNVINGEHPKINSYFDELSTFCKYWYLLVIRTDKIRQFCDILEAVNIEKQPIFSPEMKDMLIRILLETRSGDSQVLNVDIDVNEKRICLLKILDKPSPPNLDSQKKRGNNDADKNKTSYIWMIIIGVAIILGVSASIYLYSKYG